MNTTQRLRDYDHPTLLALAEVLSPSLNGASAHRLAEVIELASAAPDDVERLEPDDIAWLDDGQRAVRGERVEHWRRELDRLASVDVHLVTIADEAFPSNLRMIPNRPPLLFVRGTLERSDDRAIAVVGTRDSTERGRKCAHRIATELARLDVTVVSGLAKGIDTAAHAGALNSGGRTLAVFGTGIETVSPVGNRGLADSISDHGACVSQFWPNLRGAAWTFPIRNIVTSGLSVGTVVVEAGETSGARLQAQDALRHGKRLFLMRELVTAQPWAQDAATRPGVVTVDSVDEVIEAIDLELTTEPALL